MLWRCIVAPALDKFNNHHVCISGVVLAFGSLLAIGGRAPLDAWATAHLHYSAGIAKAVIDGASTVGLFVVWPAIIAAALGRPPNIPGGPPPPK